MPRIKQVRITKNITPEEIAAKAVEYAGLNVMDENEFLQQESMDQLIPAAEREEAPETPEQYALRMLKQKEKFVAAVVDVTKEHVPAFQHTYRDKEGRRQTDEIVDCDAILYLLQAQPDAPQITANAKGDKSGAKPLNQ